MTPRPPRHPLYALHARAFKAALKIHGVQIRLPGDADRGLRCITGPIERARHNDVVAIVGKASTSVDMVAEDYARLGNIVPNKSTVEIACGQTLSGFRSPVSEFLEFTVYSPAFDDADPCVHFTAIVTGGTSITDTPEEEEMPAPSREERIDVPIPAGAFSVDVVFATRKLTSDYFIDMSVETMRGAAFNQDIRALLQPGSRSRTGFVAELTAAPPDGNCILRVRVKI